MTKKKERRKRAKEVRRRTGVSIPVATALVKQGSSALYGESKTADQVAQVLEYTYCGDVCRCLIAQTIVGPKGSMPLREAWLG